jgi:hypothetical protein
LKRAVISLALFAAVAASPGISHAQEQQNMIVRTAGPVSARVQFSEKCYQQCEASKCHVGLMPREYHECRSGCFTQCAKRE